MERQQIDAVLDLLPNPHYNPVFIVGDSDEVINALSNRNKDYLILSVTDIDTTPIMICDYCIITDFEGLEDAPVRQEKVADFLGDCIIQEKQIVIISRTEINSMKLDGRLRSRICSGVIITQ